MGKLRHFNQPVCFVVEAKRMSLINEPVEGCFFAQYLRYTKKRILR